MALDGPEKALLTSVAVMQVFADGSEVDFDRRAVQMRAANEILSEIVDVEQMKQVAMILGALGSWGIAYLVPKAISGEDPKDWLLGYVTSAFRILDERG